MFRIIKTTFFVVVLSGLLFTTSNLAMAQNDDDLKVEFENTPLFSQANFLPGETVIRWAKATNQSGQNQTLGVQLSNYTDPDGLGNQLDIQIKQSADILYSSTLSDLAAAGEISLSNINNTQTIQYEFAVTFSPETNNDYQGKSLGFDIVLGYIGQGSSGNGDGNGGNGGGARPVYDGQLRYVYSMGKFNQAQVGEWVTLYNKSRNVLYPGTLKVDLPEKYLKFISATPNWDSYDISTGQAVWSTPLLQANGVFHLLFTVETLQPGDNLVTHVYFDNQYVHLHESGRETIKPSIGQGKDKASGGGQIVDVEDIQLALEDMLTRPDSDSYIDTLLDTLSPDDNYLVEAMLSESDQISPAVLGETTHAQIPSYTPSWLTRSLLHDLDFGSIRRHLSNSSGCSWWLWIIIVLLHLGLAYLYYHYVSRQKWLWLIPATIILAVIYILFSLQCTTPTTALATLILVYLACLVFISRYYVSNLSTKISKVRQNLKLELLIASLLISTILILLELLLNQLF